MNPSIANLKLLICQAGEDEGFIVAAACLYILLHVLPRNESQRGFFKRFFWIKPWIYLGGLFTIDQDLGSVITHCTFTPWWIVSWKEEIWQHLVGWMDGWMDGSWFICKRTFLSASGQLRLYRTPINTENTSEPTHTSLPDLWIFQVQSTPI